MDTDLQEIIKEISIMQQCDSVFIVKYYGSYFKNTDLWVRIHELLNEIHCSKDTFFNDINILVKREKNVTKRIKCLAKLLFSKFSDCDGVLWGWLSVGHHAIT